MNTTPAGYNSMVASIAPEYDPINGVYTIGDYCRYNAEIYRCVTAVTVAEAFDINKWTKVTVGGEISQLSEENTNLKSAFASDNVILLTTSRINGTNNGITFTWDGATCHIEGTKSENGNVFRNFIRENQIGSSLIGGCAYLLDLSVPNGTGEISINFYITSASAGISNKLVLSVGENKKGILWIPEDASYLVGRFDVAIASSATIDKYATVCMSCISDGKYFSNHGSISAYSSTIDADNLIDSGIYGITSGKGASSYLNFPPDSDPNTTGGMILSYDFYGNNRFIRQYYLGTNKGQYTRYKNINGFGAWVDVSATNKYCSYVETGATVDANTLISIGTYGIPAGKGENAYSNFPEDVNPNTNWGIITTVRFDNSSSNFLRQYYFRESDHILYTRHKTVRGFGGWTKLDMSNKYSVYTGNEATIDANLLTNPGTYSVPTGKGAEAYIHFPPDATPNEKWAVIITIKVFETNSNFLRQYYCGEADYILYTRHKTVHGFSEWVKIGLDNQLTYHDSVLPAFSMNKTSNGMTFTATTSDPNVITLNGTWDGVSTCFSNIIGYPASGVTPFNANSVYLMYYDSDVFDDHIVFQLFSKDENNVETRICEINRTTVIATPADAVNYLFRVVYNKSGVTLTNKKVTIKVYELDPKTYGTFANTPSHLIRGKKIALFGDSIMSGTVKTPFHSQSHCCAKYLQDELNIEVVDYSIGSIGYIKRVDGQNILERAKSADLTGCTFFVCSAGDNDSAYTIGNYDDTNAGYNDYEEPSSGITISGNVYKLVNYLHTTYPDMTIILVDKPNATKNLADKYPKYRRDPSTWVYALNHAIRDFCEYYGCGYVCLDNSGWDSWLLGQLLESDGVHMTYQGYQKLMLYIAGEVRKYTGNGDYYIQN